MMPTPIPFAGVTEPSDRVRRKAAFIQSRVVRVTGCCWTVRGMSGIDYTVTAADDTVWCTCPATVLCSHIVAVAMAEHDDHERATA